MTMGLITILFQYGHILKGHTARTVGFLSRFGRGWLGTVVLPGQGSPAARSDRDISEVGTSTRRVGFLMCREMV